MTNDIIKSIMSRTTTNLYDPSITLSDEQIYELVKIATTAPTSFNFQNWRFIAVRTAEAKARLRKIAWDQPKITDAAVTFIICGQLIDYRILPERLTPAVEAGFMPAEMVSVLENASRGLYFEQPQRQRDEAIRTGSIGATALIYAAHSLGLGSTPMIGFDADAVTKEFSLSDNEIPVLLLSVGKALPENWPQKPRRPVNEVLDFI
ncbi:putative NAD(P)H nitroreductase [Acinetobacter guillouiae]|uniref:nitroreductase family protein n=1 Tax=Acinetobacter guillouiae TaxID=106649 RepID=UPI0004EF610B|nr:nitroreductase family protein [Acinetobacter guillouiae]BAP35024.1 putative NAD(P)H nitroreductase [Acinetobacter guillouiae]